MADGTYEYIVKQRSEGALLTKKITFIALYILFPAAAAIFILTVCWGEPIAIPSCVMAIGVEVLLIFFSWRFTHVEFESCIMGNTLRITTITARSIRKTALEVDIKAFYEMGLFTLEASDKLEGMTIHKDYVFISSLDSDNIYYGIFSEGEDQCVVYFEALPEGFSHIKRLNASAARRSALNIQRGENI